MVLQSPNTSSCAPLLNVQIHKTQPPKILLKRRIADANSLNNKSQIFKSFFQNITFAAHQFTLEVCCSEQFHVTNKSQSAPKEFINEKRSFGIGVKDVEEWWAKVSNRFRKIQP